MQRKNILDLIDEAIDQLLTLREKLIMGVSNDNAI